MRHNQRQVYWLGQLSIPSTSFEMTAHGTTSLSRPLEQEELMINATAWQLPPDGEASLQQTKAAPEDFLSCKTTPGSDECHFFVSNKTLSPREHDVVPLMPDVPRVAARCRAATWDGAVRASLLKAESEGEMKSQIPSRPFLSLMLPEWVHEKAAEDEAAGISRCGSLVSFDDESTSPASSIAPSPASSCASSPASSPRVRGRRSGVCWADLAEDSDEDEPVTWAWSTASTAPSSPDRSLSPVAASLPKLGMQMQRAY